MFSLSLSCFLANWCFSKHFGQDSPNSNECLTASSDAEDAWRFTRALRTFGSSSGSMQDENGSGSRLHSCEMSCRLPTANNSAANTQTGIQNSTIIDNQMFNGPKFEKKTRKLIVDCSSGMLQQQKWYWYWYCIDTVVQWSMINNNCNKL